MPPTSVSRDQRTLDELRTAARDGGRVTGLTHRFYRYPARFSPAFVRGCVSAFSRPGDTVLDPFMGGGTTVLESFVMGRRSVGVDLNSLAVFVARTKLATITPRDAEAIRGWALEIVPRLRCVEGSSLVAERTPKNLELASVRWLRRTIEQCLASADLNLRTRAARNFSRCVMLNAGQWALNGRKRIPTASEFRSKVGSAAAEMLAGLGQLATVLSDRQHAVHRPALYHEDAANLGALFARSKRGKVNLVVTSPPYVGVHVLYHRWQVDGRKETDAPYWIANCMDGAGASYYNFADRSQSAADKYFQRAGECFLAIRGVMRKGAVLAQLVAFSRPDEQLPLYLAMLANSGFSEFSKLGRERIWRSVPGRQWHANGKGKTPSSREALLLHVAS